MSTLETLPLSTINSSFAPGEDWLGSISYTDSVGNPISLAGITFTFTLLPVGTLTTTQPPIIVPITVVGSNVISWSIFAEISDGWSGVYAISLVGSDGVYTRVLSGPQSVLNIGDPNSLTLTPYVVSSLGYVASVYDPVIASIEASITSLNTSVTSIDNSITSINASITTINASLTSTEATVTSLSASVTSFEATVDYLNSSVSSVEAEVASLNSSVTSLDTSVTNIDASISSLNASVTSINSSISSLNAAVVPSTIATELANLSSSQLIALANALLSALPQQSAGIPPTGTPFVNDSGYVVFSQ